MLYITVTLNYLFLVFIPPQLLLSFKESSPVDEVSLAMDWLKEKSLHDAGRQHRRRQNVAELIHNDSNHYFSLGKVLTVINDHHDDLIIMCPLL